MTKKIVIAVVGVLIAGLVAAQQTVNQGSGSSSVTEWRVNASGNRGGKTTEVLVDNTTVTYVPSAAGVPGTHTPLSGRKAIEIQNLGPNPIYCTVGGETPLTTGARGRKILALTDAPANVWSIDAGTSVAIKCLAGTADQVTTAATMVTELK